MITETDLQLKKNVSVNDWEGKGQAFGVFAFVFGFDEDDIRFD